MDRRRAAAGNRQDRRVQARRQRFRDRITADGSSGFKAEPGRYHLYVAHGCPWAHRTLIYRALKKLEGVITVAYSIPGLRAAGLDVRERPAFPGLHARHRQRLPLPARGLYGDRPELHRQGDGADAVGQEDQDDRQQRIVRDHPDAQQRVRRHHRRRHRLLSAGAARRDRPPQRAVYHNVNNGVYRCGFAKSQEAYEAAYDGLFATLDELEARLRSQRYLVGSQITEADWRLFPTLVRFDVAYFSLFKCNRQRIADYPNLRNYMRELYQVPGVAETVKPRYYVINYYSIARVNPTGDHSRRARRSISGSRTTARGCARHQSR